MVKFLDESDIEIINQFLNFDTSDCHVSGGVDLFTTKPVGSDRKLYKTIEKQFDQLIENNNKEFEESPNELFLQQRRRFSSNESIFHNKDTEEILSDKQQLINKLRSKSIDFNASPFGPLNETTSRRTFSYLIGILNAMYPDNDYSSLEPQDFEKIQFLKFKSKFNNILLSLGKNLDDLLKIWDNLNNHMDLLDCKFYQFNNLDMENSDYFNSNLEFNEEDEDDEIHSGKLWSYKWFCFNKKRKRVAFIYLNGYRLSSPRLYPYDKGRRRLTIDNELVEEYDLTYDSEDEKKFNRDSFEEAIEDEEDTG
ncbi:hypothetical protein WICMUC_000947 [Wickerhamomyces mucosus]|uniref:Repressor of RNA polymerase III transcription MAF1 n=1 Tax=Wickerhamomyces mucosus TaxID=1378264 RepID=A0A9P8PW19_9ASCO|nr:hypothetical protein WICMUC_000947 [Wickerhamomyces mucosus]